jgi:hypothetical protein
MNKLNKLLKLLGRESKVLSTSLIRKVKNFPALSINSVVSKLILGMLSVLLLWLCSFSQSTLAEEELQRLFTTPKERAALNDTRSKPKEQRIKVVETRSVEKDEKSQPQLPSFITFNGLVIRSHGPSTVWINGTNDLSSHNLSGQGFTVELDQIAKKSVSIVLPGNQKRTLKPGQIVNTLDGSIKENFEQP